MRSSRSRRSPPATARCRCCGASRSPPRAAGSPRSSAPTAPARPRRCAPSSARITPWSGRVLFKGEDVTRLPAHAKAARGLVLVPEGRQLFSTMTVDENLEMGAFTKRGARQLCRPPGAGVHAVPAPQGAPAAEGRHVVRRRAADAGDRPRPDDRSGDSDHRRTVAGAGAARRSISCSARSRRSRIPG